jgi:hypothetical protein
MTARMMPMNTVSDMMVAQREVSQAGLNLTKVVGDSVRKDLVEWLSATWSDGQCPWCHEWKHPISDEDYNVYWLNHVLEECTERPQ